MLLSIAIPVFNQSRDLERTLESLRKVGFFEDSRLETLISDNGSSDDTGKVGNEWATLWKRVRSFSQKENIGFSGNFDFLAEQAQGEYLWVVGAGDELIGKELGNLLSLLENEKPDWAVVNGDYSLVKPTDDWPIFQIGDSKESNKVPVFNHAISLNIIKSEFARKRKKPEISYATPPISGRKTNIGKTDIWEGETRYWPHLESIAQQLWQNPDTKLRWMFFKPSTVHLDNNAHGSWDRGFTAMKIYFQWIEVVRLASNSCQSSQWLQNLSLDLENSHLLRVLFLMRKDGNIPREELLSIVRSIPHTKKAYKWLARLVILFPTRLARLLATARNLVCTIQARFAKGA